MRDALEVTFDYSEEMVSCQGWAEDSCGSDRAYVSLTQTTIVQLTISLDPTGTPQTVAPQVALRTAFWAAGEEPAELGEASWPANMYPAGSFVEQAAEYCYRVEIESLVDGSVDVREGCLPHGELGEVGARDLPAMQIEDGLTACKEPPAGLLQSWCAGMRRDCAALSDVDNGHEGCDDLAARCGGGGDPADDVKHQHVQSCSVTTGPGLASAWPWMVSACLLALRRRPRRQNGIRAPTVAITPLPKRLVER
jgi:hypothetical protein